MKINSAVKKETLYVSLGTALLCAVMDLVFFLMGKFDLSVLWGTLLGLFTGAFNFFLMAYNLQKTVENYSDNPKKGQAKTRASYNARLLLMVIIGIIAYLTKVFNMWAFLISLTFPTATVAVRRLMLNKKGE